MLEQLSNAGRAFAPPLVLREVRCDPRHLPGTAVAARMLWDRFGGELDQTNFCPPGAAHDKDVDRRRDRGRAEELFVFQRDAASRARSILARRGGVLIADSVGLGKTHVALELLRPAFMAGERVTVVGPAALERHWRTAARGRGPFEWISYSSLSRGSVPPGARDFVVFDEAHALRNPAARRYGHAQTLVRGALVILLTATPINNSLWDLYHLLRLFSGDRDFADVGVASLRAAFDEAKSTCLLGSATAVQPVLREIVIRRTRSAVSSRYPESDLRFPTQRAPVPVHYAFSAASEPDLLEITGAALLELSFPVHRASGVTPVELLRRSLFKRLESSVYAFGCSVRRYEGLLQRSADALERGLLVHIGDSAEDDSDQLSFDELLYEPVERSRIGVLRVEIARERGVIERMRVALETVADAKALALERLLLGPLRDQRVIVFTQFRDSARYLHGRLSRSLRVGLVDGGTAVIGDCAADRSSVVRRFAPTANGARPPAPHEAIDVLVATDVMSEGFNLQDASVVVSYDLPWNPIRLVQRVGRIDRLGSSHATVASYHFLPGDLDRYLGLLERIAAKTSAIEATVGADIPTLHATVLRALDRRDAATLARVEEEADPFAVDAKLRALQGRVPAPQPRIGFEYATVAVPAPARAAAAVIAARVGTRVEWLAVRDGRATVDDRVCADLLAAAADQPELGSALAPAALEELLRPARQEIARRQAIIESTPLIPPGGAANRIGRRMLDLAAAVPGGADVDVCARIEEALERLAHAPAALVSRVAAPSKIAAAGLDELLSHLEGLPRAPTKSQISETSVEVLAAIVNTNFER